MYLFPSVNQSTCVRWRDPECRSYLISLAAQHSCLVSLAAGAMHARLTMPDGPRCDWNMEAVSHSIFTDESQVHTISVNLAVPQRCMLQRSLDSHASAHVPRMLLGVLSAHGNHPSLPHCMSLVNAHQILASLCREVPVNHASVTSGRQAVCLSCMPLSASVGVELFLATAAWLHQSSISGPHESSNMSHPFILDQMEQVVALNPPERAEALRQAVRSLHLCLSNLQGLEGDEHTIWHDWLSRKHAKFVQMVHDAETGPPRPSRAPSRRSAPY